ncbi:hypothetical protein [Chryseobacterium sp. Bi04]|uniref:hypothetical protein n=1 Tax=Chryseobacterium sp. Bi04 TaxID=2822345 RepID=UPI001D95249F|nr:hypothetical protein [Chryseobacterium sp. Bi04]CAH0176781.1 hypothetical protein SRABI04_01398 [Chryseobacterium sp. Bi04]
MKKKITIRLVLLVVIFLVSSCRNDYVPEQNQTFAPNASKFRILNLKEVPKVETFIHKESGRKDLVLPLSGNNTISGKTTTAFGETDPSLVVQQTIGNEIYYVLKINAALENNAIYNLEVKEVNGTIVKAEVIEYTTKPGTSFDFWNFNGTVSSYSLRGDPIHSSDYEEGQGDCPPGGGTNPDYNGSDNPNPGGNGPYYGGGGQGTDPIHDTTGCWEVLLNSEKPWLTDGYYNNCTGATVYLNRAKGASRLSADCGDGSGVIIGDENNRNPCEKLKAQTNNSTFKNNIASLKGKTGESYESGYRIDKNTDGSLQNQLLQNKPGTQEVDMKVFSNTNTLMHSHYDGLYPMFSPGDIIFFNQWIVWAQNWNSVATNTPKIPLNNLTFTLVTSEGNYSFIFDGEYTASLPNYTQRELDDLNDKYMRLLDEAKSVANVSGNVSYNMEKLEKQFLKFIDNKMNMIGLKLYKTTENGNSELNLINGNRKETPCPN